MPRSKKASPSYLLHRATGQARVRLKINGRFRDVYLGAYGSPESWEKYHRTVTEHLQEHRAGDKPTLELPCESVLSLAALVVKYDEFARTYYVKNGETTNDRFKAGINALVRRERNG